jgi:hypothetical protein
MDFLNSGFLKGYLNKPLVLFTKPVSQCRIVYGKKNRSAERDSQHEDSGRKAEPFKGYRI